MKAKVTVYADQAKHKISKNLFGHFMEHCSTIIYDSIYAPGHPLADEDGFRTDVLEVLREVGTPMLRYPGGNFVSNYHWEDGIGPVEKRPKTFDYAWHTEDDNRFGTVEFIKLCRKVGAEPYICVNMGSGTAEEAMHWVEFCNGTGDSKYAALRKAQGFEEPFQVKYWGLGNEMYGDWQFGKMTAEKYAEKALDFAKAMTWFDPTIKLIACGHEISSHWNYTVAKALKPLISHMALHHYSIGYDIFHADNYEECMYIPEYIKKLSKVGMADLIAGTDDAYTDIKLAWDEWNTHAWELDTCEEPSQYSMFNVMLTATIMHAFIQDGDIVDIASYSPFMNIGGAVCTTKDSILKRAQYYVFKLFREAFEACPDYLAASVDCKMQELEEIIDRSNRLPAAQFALNAKEGKRIVQAPYVDFVASLDEARTKMCVSVVNKSRDEECELDLTVYGLNLDLENMTCKQIYHEDLNAYNTIENPNEVVCKEVKPVIKDGKIVIREHSVNVFMMPVK